MQEPAEKLLKEKGQSLHVIIHYWTRVQAIVGGERVIRIHVIDSVTYTLASILVQYCAVKSETTTLQLAPHTARIQY